MSSNKKVLFLKQHATMLSVKSWGHENPHERKKVVKDNPICSFAMRGEIYYNERENLKAINIILRVNEYEETWRSCEVVGWMFRSLLLVRPF